MIPDFLDRKLIPHKSGVYIYRNSQGQVIYVGKALDLYHRVSSYFNGSNESPKTSQLVAHIASLETVIVQSELEALILEANLIKKYKPRYNIRLTDDKDYLYIKVTYEEFPRIITARKKDLTGALKFFGPFPSSTTVKSTLRNLRRVFPWCANPHGKRACFYRHIKLCPGPCSGEISQAEYEKIIKHFISFMSGKKAQLIDELIREMNFNAAKQNFEAAQRIKKTLEGVTYLTQPNKTQVYLENPNFLEDERNLGLKEMRDILKLTNSPARIEGYDISNIQGHDAVASMVVLTNGEIDKSQYRKFKIHITGKPNDFAMLAEVIRRRMKNDWKKPDLFLIDGGYGQVSAVYNQIQKTGSLEFKEIPIFGLAKRMEWLYDPSGAEIRLPRASRALRLLQKLRDEAHRFAITFHRKRRSLSLYN